jgi:hypothetical protein
LTAPASPHRISIIYVYKNLTIVWDIEMNLNSGYNLRMKNKGGTKW